ncbi:hypothetical protein ACH9D2_07335 [Kocuria sp. M4R2S49]|uniref:hypothetical protein n=1 Tax=Kocuria rhizosphaericola TaxID=3376284 RepID=UPI0037B0128E
MAEGEPAPSDVVVPELPPDQGPPEGDRAAGPEQFLGSFPQDPAFASFLADNGCYQGLQGHQVCDQIGVEFAFGGSGRATTVFFSPGYAGALPGGITIGDTPEDVVATLGEPDETTALSMAWQVADNVRLVVSFPADADGAFSGTPRPFVVNGVSYHLG